MSVAFTKPVAIITATILVLIGISVPLSAQDSDIAGDQSIDDGLIQSNDTLQARIDAAIANRQWAPALTGVKQRLRQQHRQYPKTRFPRGHVEIARTLIQMGQIQHQLNAIDAALDSYQQATAMLLALKHESPNSPELLLALSTAYDGQGTELFLLREFEKSLDAERLAIRFIRCAAPGSLAEAQCERLALLHENLFASLERLNLYSDAVRTLQRTIELRSKPCGSTLSPVTRSKLAGNHLDLARIFEKTGQLAASAVEIKESEAIVKDTPNSRVLPQQMALLSTILMQKGKLGLTMGHMHAARSAFVEALDLDPMKYPGSVTENMARASLFDGLLTLAVIEGNVDEIMRCRAAIKQVIAEVIATNPPPLRVKTLITYETHLAVACQNLGQFEQAERHYQNCLSRWRHLAPNASGPLPPDPILASTLSNCAALYHSLGRYRESYVYQMQALRMAQTLFPPDRYPDGHRSIVTCTLNLAALLWAFGEYETALTYYDQGVDLGRRLWPTTAYPNGNRYLLSTLKVAADALAAVGRFDRAEGYYEEAAAMANHLFPLSEYPNGHVEHERIDRGRGQLELERGNYTVALDYYQAAMASAERRLDPASRKCAPDLAIDLDRIAECYRQLGAIDRAEEFGIRSLEYRRVLFPQDTYQAGHPYIAKALRSLTLVYCNGKRFDEAYRMAHDAVVMECNLADEFAAGASDAQILNYIAKRIHAIDLLMSTWQAAGVTPTDAYASVWRRRCLAARLISEHHRRIREFERGEMRTSYRRYMDVQRQLAAALIFTSSDSKIAADRRRRLRALNDQKEVFERQLAGLSDRTLLGRVAPKTEISRLADRLPPDAVFLDFTRFEHRCQAPAEGRRPANTTLVDEYGVFVVSPSGPVAYVALGSAAAIDEQIVRWREELVKGTDTSAGQILRDLVWRPITQHLTNSVKTLYICPDGRLMQMPWAALPVTNGSRLLIENYLPIIVPDGRSLLDGTPVSKALGDSSPHVLTIGNVDYDFTGMVGSSGQPTGLKRIQWSPLPATNAEIRTLRGAFQNAHVMELSGQNATVDRFLAAAGDVSVIHIATHGFYVDTPLQTELGLATDARPHVDAQPAQSRRSVLERNPFLLSGLVLAGANHSVDRDRNILAPLPGILTAQDIASLTCPKLYLVVLSGCKTSLGSRSDGSPFSLQTAFHIAGAQNVVATLWDVEDQAAARLMKAFYANLSTQDVAPAAALRAAQLEMLHAEPNAKQRDRGPNLSSTVKLLPRQSRHRLTASQWAAWTISRTGL